MHPCDINKLIDLQIESLLTPERPKICVSVEKGHPKYIANAGIISIVTLDGEEVFGCITADEIEGKVLNYVRSPDNGNSYIVTGDEIAVEWRYGQVCIHFLAPYNYTHLIYPL